MKGGYRASAGERPDPDSISSAAGRGGEWRVLPRYRRGPIPKWPLNENKATGRELYWWRYYWRQGQAVMWERQGQNVEVALYCQLLAEVETGDASAAAITQRRQAAEALGLTLIGMRAHRWKIAETDEETESAEPEAQPEPGTPRPSARARFATVTDLAAREG